MVASHSSSSTPSSTGNADIQKADDIHAFRTITSFLEYLRQFPIDQITDNAPTEGPKADELRLYSALASIAVMDLEVMSVGCNKVPSDISDESLPRADSDSVSGLSVIVSPGEETLPELEGPEKLSGLANIVYHYYCVFVNNFLRRDKADAPAVPAIKDLSPPAGFSFDKDEDFDKFIKEYP